MCFTVYDDWYHNLEKIFSATLYLNKVWVYLYVAFVYDLKYGGFLSILCLY